MKINSLQIKIFIFIFLSCGMKSVVLSSENNKSTIYVNNIIGDDKFNGLSKTVDGNNGPVKTIQRALNIVQTSGRVEIINTDTPYPPGIRINKIGGTAEAPLVIEGNGAEINGLGVVNPSEWKLVEKQIYSRPFWPMSNSLKSNKDYDYWIGIPTVWWIDGKPGINCKSKAELNATPRGFWWNKSEQSVWFHLPQNKTFESMEIKMPQTGVGGGTCFNINGKVEHIIVQNLKSSYSFNDGFSAHGEVDNIIFRNCIATDNCGQGFSMHDNAKIIVEDSYAARNASSGACDVGNANVTYKRCVFTNNSFEAGVYTTGTVTAIYEDCIISNNQPFEQVWQRGQSNMHLKNCLITGYDNSKSVVMIERGSVTFEHCTLVGGASIATGRHEGNSLMMNQCLLIDIDEMAPAKVSYSIKNSETNTKNLVNADAPDNVRYVQIKSQKQSFPMSKTAGAKLPASVVKMFKANY